MLTLTKHERRGYGALYALLVPCVMLAVALRPEAEPLILPSTFTAGYERTDTSFRIELNLAQPVDLLQIKGLGPKTVENILYCRKCLGGFSNKKQLQNIPGIGKTTFERVDSLLVLTPLGHHIWATLSPYRPSKTADLNAISSAELQRTCLLDKTTAQRLINRRKSHNGFKNWTEIADIDGVGWANVRRLRRHFHLSNLQLITLNNSKLSDWEQLPGIGPKTAQKILDYREALGGFVSLTQLKEIKGIGKKTLEKLEGRIVLSAAPEELKLLNLSKASLKELSSHPYINAKQAQQIDSLRQHRILSTNALYESGIMNEIEFRRLQPYLTHAE